MTAKKQAKIGAFIKAGASGEAVRLAIIGALNNKAYKARTIGGIANETKLQVGQVANALSSDRMLGARVKVYPVRSKDGRVLVTTKERFVKEASPKEKFIDFFASKRVWVRDVE